jgi:UDP-glucose 4-epimerase
MPVSLTDGLQVRDFTYVDDVVSALLLASNCDLEAYSAYNVCSGHPISVRTVAETTARILDRPSDLLKFGSLPTRLDEPAFVVGDPSRFNSATGWTPTVSLDEGIRRMINLYRLQVGTYSEQ